MDTFFVALAERGALPISFESIIIVERAPATILLGLTDMEGCTTADEVLVFRGAASIVGLEDALVGRADAEDLFKVVSDVLGGGFRAAVRLTTEALSTGLVRVEGAGFRAASASNCR